MLVISLHLRSYHERCPDGALSGTLTRKPRITMGGPPGRAGLPPHTPRRPGRRRSASERYPPVSEPIHITIILHEQSRADLEELVVDRSNPESPRFGEYLSRDELRALVALKKDECDGVLKWLRSCGMEPLDTGPVGGQAL